MQTKEIRQSVQLFDSSDKWLAFVELAQEKESLEKAMHRTAYDRLKSYFLKSPCAAGWTYKPIDNDEQMMLWYLTEHHENSICIVFGWRGQFWMEARGGETYNNLDRAVELLKEPKFANLLTAFERVDQGVNGVYLANEAFNFSFGTPFDTRFTATALAWHAQFETEKFLEQVVAKVARFQTPEMTDLLNELNQLTRK
ncbi:hypothetical protein GCM10023185_29100 [Hymenobacter saemangeumensis]|uniref:DUF4375 domain-containing protein n=1 Tax=Hymenobacter saemangeumensis TaxID=1084522 RepID=A0ABP8IKT1_9BACT